LARYHRYIMGKRTIFRQYFNNLKQINHIIIHKQCLVPEKHILPA
jgi:hypothetical protein